MSHTRRTLASMLKRCPECGGELIDLEPAAEIGSRPVQYDCPECELWFAMDASGLLTEVE